MDETTSEALDAEHARKASAKKKRKKYGGRKRGSINKRTIEKVREGERKLAGARQRGEKIAVDYMDEMIVWFRNIVGVMQPFDEKGLPRPGYNADIWFRAVAAFQGFLSMRAPYQSPRLSAIAIMPAQQGAQRTTVNVTILNERGDKVYSDSDKSDDMKLIEHEPAKDDEAA